MKTHGWEKAIVAAVADPTPEVRLAALLALWCSGDSMRCADLPDPAVAVSRLAPLLDKATEDEDVFTLLRAIGPAKTPEARDAIGRFLVRIDEGGHFSESILLEAVDAYEVVSGAHMTVDSNRDARKTVHRAAELWKQRAK